MNEYIIEMVRHGDWSVKRGEERMSIYANAYAEFVFALVRGWEAAGRDPRDLVPAVPSKYYPDSEREGEIEKFMQQREWPYTWRAGLGRVTTTQNRYCYTAMLEGTDITFAVLSDEVKVAPVRIPIDDVPQIIDGMRNATDIEVPRSHIDALLVAYVTTPRE